LGLRLSGRGKAKEALATAALAAVPTATAAMTIARWRWSLRRTQAAAGGSRPEAMALPGTAAPVATQTVGGHAMAVAAERHGGSAGVAAPLGAHQAVRPLSWRQLYYCRA
jgi:hypothetical protein